jgi:methylated-DNA-[protein]-cysteine S-methyltransferase
MLSSSTVSTKLQSAPTLTAHQRRVYHLLTLIPPGKVTTYGEIARALGNKGARAVGNTLNKNPFAPQIPCHRVVTADGSLGGYAGGAQKKTSLLMGEGVAIYNGKVVDFDKRLYLFTSEDLKGVANLAV